MCTKINDFINTFAFILWSGLYWKIVANSMSNNSNNAKKIEWNMGHCIVVIDTTASILCSVLCVLYIELSISKISFWIGFAYNDSGERHNSHTHTQPTKKWTKVKNWNPNWRQCKQYILPQKKETRKKSVLLFALCCRNRDISIACHCLLKWWSILTHFIQCDNDNFHWICCYRLGPCERRKKTTSCCRKPLSLWKKKWNEKLRIFYFSLSRHKLQLLAHFQYFVDVRIHICFLFRFVHLFLVSKLMQSNLHS